MWRNDVRRVATAIHFLHLDTAGVKACTPDGVTRSGASASTQKYHTLFLLQANVSRS